MFNDLIRPQANIIIMLLCLTQVRLNNATFNNVIRGVLSDYAICPQVVLIF